MSTAIGSFQIPIDTTYEQQKNDTASDLQTRVLQIINQKGHFRHVTEQSLLAEEDSGDDEADEDVRDEDSNVEATPEKRDEELVRSRDDMLQQLNRAQNDTLVALELVSFLLSKHSVPARSTMSDELKKRVPTGTLDSRVVQKREISSAKVKEYTLNARGWRSEGFSKVSQALASSSDRLRKESDRESEYWKQVASLKESQMAVSRYPRDNSAVAIHYGSVNAAPQFQQRGVTLLRQDANSNIYLDRGNASSNLNRLQVEIFRGSCRTGRYESDPDSIKDTSNIAHAITTARDELSEEELLYEIGREARILANQGVTSRDQTISFEVGAEYQVSISLKSSMPVPNTEALKDKSLAEYIGLSLRALLQEAHRNVHERRTRTPPPMVTKLKAPPEYAVLRPLISELKHRAAVEELKLQVTKTILNPVRRAGLEIDWRDTSVDSSEANGAASRHEILISTKASRSRCDLILPSGKQLSVTTTSHLGSPVYGTQHELSGLDHHFAPIGVGVYRDLNVALNALLEMVALDIVACAASVENPDISDTMWTVTRPHNGELILSSRKSRKTVAGMRIDLVDGTLILRLAPATPEYQKSRKLLAWTWSDCDSSTAANVTGSTEDVGISRSIALTLSFNEVVKESLKMAE